MPRVDLEIPMAILDALPDEDDDTAADMRRAVTGWEDQINRLLEEDPGAVVDILDRFADRWERYDEFIVELRAWGQSPIYAMAWRDLHEALIQQLHTHDELADVIDRERHARIVENGIRQQD